MFKTDEDLLSWVRGQVWVLKNGTAVSNDNVALPAGRTLFAFERLEALLGPLVTIKEAPPEYEPRNPNAAMAAPRNTPKASKPKATAPKKPAPKTGSFGLSKPERAMLDAIKAAIADGKNPTYRGLAAAVGIKSHAGVPDAIAKLKGLGLIDVIGSGRAQRIVVAD